MLGKPRQWCENGQRAGLENRTLLEPSKFLCEMTNHEKGSVSKVGTLLVY